MNTAENITVIGSSGAIGGAFIKALSNRYPDAGIHAFSRQTPKNALPQVCYHMLDYSNESAIATAAVIASKQASIDFIVVATGALHGNGMMPEKSLNALSASKFQRSFEINAIFPALVAKHFLPRLNKERRCIFAVLSARVGSISDNRLGGWYAYRASKAALNMIIKNAAIETARRHKQAIIVGLHPGTVDSHLSKPFQHNVPDAKLLTPDDSAAKLLNVLENLTAEHSGKCFAWDGKEILP